MAKSTEKVMSVTISFHNTDAKAILIDSLNFLPSSLQSLVDNLKKKSIVKAIDDDDITDMNASTFQHTTKFFKQKFPELDSSALSLLLQKGIYPYNYITSLEKLSETALPKKDAFFNTLSQEHITDEEYARAQEIWKTFKCKTLGDYHDIYLMSDTCLLADVFENFRSESMRNYGLDPVFFISSPGLSWAAALLHTKQILEIVKDVDISLFIDSAMLGGVSQANHPIYKSGRCEKTNQLHHLMLLDVNNQYGHAMCQALPVGGFSFLPSEEVNSWDENKILSIPDDDDHGYFLEVDLIYPQELHELHDEYPLAPEHYLTKVSDLSEYQHKMRESHNLKMGKHPKLCLTLFDKVKYKLHYRNLKQYLQLGLRIGKIHRILKFQQHPWLKSYIDLNTRIRQSATCKADEVSS